MVPMPGAGGSAQERNLRFLVLLREREEEIELEIPEVCPKYTQMLSFSNVNYISRGHLHEAEKGPAESVLLNIS